MSKLLAIVIVLLVATTALAANVQKHLLWERAYGEIFWSDKDAFLFVTRTREGWSGSVVQYAWEVARNFFWLPRRPTDRLSWMEVTHLSSTTSSLTVAPNTNASPLGVVGGRIYANYQDTKSKWLSDKFVAVSDDEWDAAARAFKGGSFRDIDGWSREMNLINREPGSTMLLLTVEGRPITVSIVQDENRKTILAELPSKEKLTLLDVNTTRSDVDATAYQRAFLQSR